MRLLIGFGVLVFAKRIGQLSWMQFLKIYDQAKDHRANYGATQSGSFHPPTTRDCWWRHRTAY